MKNAAVVALLVCLSAMSAAAAETEVEYYCSPDAVSWRLFVADSSYRLEIATLDGKTCSEAGVVERDGEKMRFVAPQKGECREGRRIRGSWFVVVPRNGREFLVRADEIPALEERLKIDPDRMMWFPYFMRAVTKEKKESNQSAQTTTGLRPVVSD